MGRLTTITFSKPGPTPAGFIKIEDVLARFGWSPDDLGFARSCGFPPSHERRTQVDALRFVRESFVATDRVEAWASVVARLVPRRVTLGPPESSFIAVDRLAELLGWTLDDFDTAMAALGFPRGRHSTLRRQLVSAGRVATIHEESAAHHEVRQWLEAVLRVAPHLRGQ